MLIIFKFFIGTVKPQIYRMALVEWKLDLLNTCHNSVINDIAFPFGTSELFATCSFEDIRVWHSATNQELLRIKQAARYAHSAGLQVNAGHGLHFHNVEEICALPEIVELNIGHSIIAQALFSGLAQTVKELKQLMKQVRSDV